MGTSVMEDAGVASDALVSKEEIASFRREGLLRIDLRNLLGDKIIDELCTAFYRVEAAGFPDHKKVVWNDSPSNALFYLHAMFKHYPEFAAVSLSPKIGEVAARLAGVDHVRLLYDQLMIKQPGMAATPWHQDLQDLPFNRRNHIVFWIAIDDLDETMGLTRYVPRSHKIGPLPRALAYDPKKIHLMSEEEILRGRPSEDVTSLLREDDLEVVGDVVSYPLRSGEAIIHDGLMLHGAGANRSDRPRRVHQLTIIPADTQYNGMPFPSTDGLGLVQYGRFDHPNFPIIY